MMYDELIKNLRHDSASALQNCEFDFVHNWMLKAANAIEELEKQLREEKVDNVNLTGWLAEEHAKLDRAEIENIKLKEEFAKYRGKNRWISVTERLPELGEVVLLTDGKDTGDGYLAMYDFSTECPLWSTPFVDLETENITHWMPLPEPPKDGEA